VKSADQNGTGPASVVVIVACIPDPRIDRRLARQAYFTPAFRRLYDGLRIHRALSSLVA
jgi:hypothetical protein